ncbi:MAG: 1-acyl-sn-glycerol-3-phosphate acyltransferase [Deltaproteobacteria bacterium]|nr:1-acyl-sn-glycerol-3-phosphate acyltransferase [Deltaproteobacteria bacterium]
MSPPRFLLLVLTNAAVYPALVLWTIVCITTFPLSFPAVLVATRWPADKVTRFLIWVYGRGWLALVAPFVWFRREGFDPGVGQAPCILVVNHLSFFDTFFMGALPFFDVTFAVRSWPFKMLWFTGFMKLARYLDVEAMTGEETFATARATLSRGGRILFFPEGHRSRDGKLHRFHTGAFRLAVQTGVPLVPLVLTGTGRFLPPGRWWFAPTRVRLRALPPLDSAAFTGPLAHRRLRDAVWAQMDQVLTGTP